MNISFLSPYFLMALPLLAVPLLIHLLTQRKGKDIAFSTLRFIKLAIKQESRWIKLKNLLLLILRILLIITLILIFARPLLKLSSSYSLTGDPKSSTVLILDNSYSMGTTIKGKMLFERGKELAKTFLKKAAEGSEFSFILTGGSGQEVKLTTNVDRMASLVHEASLSYLSADLSDAFRRAYETLSQAKHKEKKIILLTDLGQNGWENFKKVKIDPGVKVLIVNLLEEEVANRAVSEVLIIPEKEKLEEQIKVKVSNFSRQGISNLPLSLSIDGRQTSRSLLQLKEREEAVCNFSFLEEKRGIFEGKVKIPEDPLKVDDKYHFILPSPFKIKVLCVDGSPSLSSYFSESFYLFLAISSLRGGKISPTLATVDEIGNYDLKGFDVIILANVKKMKEEETLRLLSFVKSGGGLLIFAGDKIDREWYNQNLGSVLPGSLIGQTKEAIFKISKMKPDHSLLSPFYQEKGIERPTFYQYLRIDPLKAGTLLELENGDPLLLELKPEGERWGRVMLFASSIDADWTNFPAFPAYPPFLQRMVLYAANFLEQEERQALVGEIYTKHLKNPPYPEKVFLYPPSGEKRELAITEENGEKMIRIGELKEPGVYKLRLLYPHGEVSIDYFAVNLDFSNGESDLTRIKESRIKEIAKEMPLTIKKESEVESLSNLAFGREISKNLIVLFLGLLFLEGLVAISRRRVG